MEPEGETTSVFTDDSGARARALVWGTRGALVIVLLGGVALVFSLVTQVTLPGLDGPVHLPGGGTSKAGKADPTPPAPTEQGTTGVDQSVLSPTSTSTAGPGTPGGKPTTPANPGTTPTVRPTTVPSAPATPGKSHSPNANSNASAAPRATPTHTAGGQPTTPPGQTKP